MKSYLIVYQQVGKSLKEIYFTSKLNLDTAKEACLNEYPLARIHEAYRIVKDSEHEDQEQTR